MCADGHPLMCLERRACGWTGIPPPLSVNPGSTCVVFIIIACCKINYKGHRPIMAFLGEDPNT